MFMVTDLKALLSEDYEQLYWFSREGLSKCIDSQHQNSLELLFVCWQSDSGNLRSLNFLASSDLPSRK